MFTYFIAILCVAGLALGQILFKLSSNALAEHGSFFDSRVMIYLVSAMALYGITSIVWVWILQKLELGRVYPIMAMAFILVPLGSYFVFGEKFNNQYFIGILLITSGIVIAVKS